MTASFNLMDYRIIYFFSILGLFNVICYATENSTINPVGNTGIPEHLGITNTGLFHEFDYEMSLEPLIKFAKKILAYIYTYDMIKQPIVDLSLLISCTNTSKELFVNKKEIISNAWVFVICASVAMLFVLIMPIAGMLFFFCRCCGKCGGTHMYHDPKNARCKRLFFFSMLMVINTILLIGVVVVYLSSFLVHSRLSGDGNGSFNEKITETVQYANAFRDNFKYTAKNDTVNVFMEGVNENLTGTIEHLQMIKNHTSLSNDVLDSLYFYLVPIFDVWTPVFDHVATHIQLYAKYWQISTLVVASLLMLIPVLYYVGMMFGSCGGRPGHGVQCCNKGIGANFLLGGVSVTFLLSSAFMLLCFAFFAICGFLLAGMCRYVFDPNPNNLQEINYLVDEVTGWENKLKTANYTPPTFTTFLMRCKENSTLYYALNLHSGFLMADYHLFTDIGVNCREMYDAFLSASDAICVIMLDPLNMFWLSLAGCTLLLVPSLVFAVKLVGLYRCRYKRCPDQVMDDPSRESETIPLPCTNQCHSAASLGMVNAGFANDDFRQMKDLVDGYGVIQPPSYESHISAYDVTSRQ